MTESNKKLYLDYAAVEKHCLTIGRSITLHTWKPDYIVGITRGGLLPATLLSQYLDVPMYSLDVSLRDSVSEPTSNLWMSEDAMNGKHILIVDDINDTGATTQWIFDDWRSSCRPESPEWNDIFGSNVRVAVIVNNESSDFKEIAYSGLTINKAEENVWVVFPTEDWWTAKPLQVIT